MFSKTQTIEKGYSDAEKREIKKVFIELREFGKTKEAKEFVKKVEARLKA